MLREPITKASPQLDGRGCLACQGAERNLTLYGQLNRGAYSRSVMIEITDRITLNEAEIVVTYIRTGGPGGQNVNCE